MTAVFFRPKGLRWGCDACPFQEDLDHGRQPMVSEDEQIALVFNGEIINHQPPEVSWSVVACVSFTQL